MTMVVFEYYFGIALIVVNLTKKFVSTRVGHDNLGLLSKHAEMVSCYC